MVGILSKFTLYFYFSKRFLKCNFVCNSILLLFKNDSFTIEFVVDQEDNISFQKEEWPKLIFGVVEPKYLIGFKADKNEFILNVLFPKMSPQIPWLDQF